MINSFTTYSKVPFMNSQHLKQITIHAVCVCGFPVCGHKNSESAIFLCGIRPSHVKILFRPSLRIKRERTLPMYIKIRKQNFYLPKLFVLMTRENLSIKF